MKKRFFFPLLLVTFSGLLLSAQDLNFDENIRRMIENAGRDTQAGNQTNIVSESSSRSKIRPSRLFMPPVFRLSVVTFDMDITLSKPLRTDDVLQTSYYKKVKPFQKEMLRLQIENMASLSLQRNQPSLFQYSINTLPTETIRRITYEKTRVEVDPVNVDPDNIEAPKKFIPDRKYWRSSLESSMKFSENSTSNNWHSGPTERTIINIFTRNIIKYNYEKDIIKWDNELEVKLNFYNAPNDTLRQYKVNDDLLRIHSTYGVKALKKWYYTLFGEFKTQLFANYQENTTQMQAALLSPYVINLGLGMKYDHTQQYKRRDRSLVMSVNLAPISYTYMSSAKDSINWGRHGFPKDKVTGSYKRYLSKLGSTIDFNMTLKPNRDVTWKSRFNYFTSYDRVVCEFENSFDFAVSRFFSTLLYLNLRYDDGVTKTDEASSYIQWNQLVSFGFSYKW